MAALKSISLLFLMVVATTLCGFATAQLAPAPAPTSASSSISAPLAAMVVAFFGTFLFASLHH